MYDQGHQRADLKKARAAGLDDYNETNAQMALELFEALQQCPMWSRTMP